MLQLDIRIDDKQQYPIRRLRTEADKDGLELLSEGEGAARNG